MATQDNSSGLLSKVAKFVRNPTKDWSELDKPAELPPSDDGKEALKRMIQRKRHDDAVRKYEFAKLRKLRQDSSTAKVDMTQVTTEFRSSSGDIDDDERETTLKKIDDIEAQMSQQWWKGRGNATQSKGETGDAQVKSEASPRSSVPPPIGAQPFPPTLPSQVPDSTDDVPTAMSVPVDAEYQATVPSPGANVPDKRANSPSSRRVFSPSKMAAVDMPSTVSDPELEEAAIRYANGDDMGAEAALLTALQLIDAKSDAIEGWMAALFDLYRSTAQQASFERMALEYAHRFGRSGPLWDVTVPASLLRGTRGQSVSGGLSERTSVRWDCPAVLDEVGLERLGWFVDSPSANYLLDWEAIESIAPPAVLTLGNLVSSWCEQRLSFTFVGADLLITLLRQMSPSGDKTVPEHVWMLRLDILRLMMLQDDYELTALDFCVTYEVSPPPWRDPVCRHVFKAPASSHESTDFEATHFHGDPHSDFGQGETHEDTPFKLQGELLGDVAAVVTDWQQFPVPEGIWVIDCSRLTRVDFSAAGSLLNWVAKAQEEGAAIEFQDVPRLVAAFFNLIGINEYARVLPRAL
jgi:ABC-type transporter Mla MlaB component